jgi:calpain-7
MRGGGAELPGCHSPLSARRRAVWIPYASTAMAHLKEMNPLYDHVMGWKQALSRVEAAVASARRAEVDHGDIRNALKALGDSGAVLVSLMKAIDATTGAGNRGDAAVPPWSWFAADTREVFSAASSRAEWCVKEMERIRSAPPSRRPVAASSGAFDMSGMASALPSASSAAVVRTTSGSRKFTVEEIAVLRRTSYIQGNAYLPWTDSDATDGFEGPRASFTDPTGRLTLSASQQRRFGGWKRPHELWREPCVLRGDRPSAFSVVQELVGDCSFLSSLCAAAEFENRTGKRLISSLIYPQDGTGKPRVSPSGRYVVKLQLNGVWRRVEIDDEFPVDSRGKLLCSFSNAGEMWVSLLEKAFLKVVGSYAFAGSTSSKDLHVLTGWLPETWRTSGSDWDAELAWNRLSGGHQYNDVLASIGTRSMSTAEEEVNGLVGGHAYAVLDIREIRSPDGSLVRALKVKNPWGHRRFRGALDFDRTSFWTPAVCKELHVGDFAASVDNGVFWATWEEVIKFFPDVFLSWQPSLLPFRSSMHGCWPLAAPGPKMDNYSFQFCPQFRLSVGPSPSTGSDVVPVWVLVTRHATVLETDEEGGDFADGVPRGPASASSGDSKPFLGTHVFCDKALFLEKGSACANTGTHSGMGFASVHSQERAGEDAASSAGASNQVCASGALGGERVYFPSSAVLRGVYSNTPYLLTRLNLRPPAKGMDLTLVLSQYERKHDVDYSVAVFGSSPVTLGPVIEPFTQFGPVMMGAWGPGTDGGRASCPRYFDNPQFLLTTTVEDDVQLVLRGPSALSIDIRVFAGAPEEGHLKSFRFDTAFSSKYYTRCFTACSSRKLPPGRYTVLVSTWDEGERGRFHLTVAGGRHAPVMIAI